LLALVALLAGCGADGEPVQPQASATISAGSGGVYAQGKVGIKRGPLTATLGYQL
jgi:hypothetical protein